jgi:plastocyanin
VTGSSFDSGLVSPGGTFSHKFNQNGTFDYACQLHPWMTGQVIVGTGGTTPVPLPIPPTPSPTPSPSIPPVTPQAKISISLGAADKKVTEYFVPKSLTVKANEIVTWKNDDVAVHTVTSGSGAADGIFDSGLLGPGKSFSFAFTKQGTFDYFCQVHPWMTGQITVSGVAAQPQTSPPSASLPSPPVIPSTQNTLLKKPPTISKVSIPSGAANKEVIDYFVPKTLTIKTLDSVQWTNQDLAAHTVTSGLVEKGGDGMFDSGLLPAGKSFQFEFKKAGTIDYFCTVHPWMTGKVIVKGDAAAKGKVNSPLKQKKSGVPPEDVECRSGLELVLKATDGSPACIKSETKVKLVKRGWASS